jgi:hypothetical protein
MANPDAHTDIIDVAIVGAGVAGVYTGWRLITASAQENKHPRIAVFESSDRIGGRLLSIAPPGISNTRVELGGMRFTSGHLRVKGLLEKLGIASKPFPVQEPQNLAYLRGHALRIQDFETPEKLPYHFRPDERTPATMAEGFVALAARRFLRVVLGKDVDLAKVNWRDVVQNSTLDGRPLRDYPLRYVLQRFISNEALRFADDSSGYDTILSTWNAADGLPWNLADFGKNVSYFNVPVGYDSIPLALAERFEAAGGTLHLCSRLIGFDETNLVDRSKAIELRFAGGGAAPATMLARKLILAMPRRSIELLDRSGVMLAPTEENNRVQRLIGSVTPIPLFKLALCYHYPWWETIDPVQVQENGALQWRRLTEGESITDLPVRQCYYWAVNRQTQNSVILVYDDGSDRIFWAGLRDRTFGKPFVDEIPADANDSASPQWTANKAPALMVDEVHRQLMALHGVSNRLDIPQPYAAAYRDWGDDPYGGGANFWTLHVDSDQVAVDILQPKPPVPVFICGEAYSHNQGWVEGALATADQMLQLHFGLREPDWPGRPTVGA